MTVESAAYPITIFRITGSPIVVLCQQSAIVNHVLIAGIQDVEYALRYPGPAHLPDCWAIHSQLANRSCQNTPGSILHTADRSALKLLVDNPSSWVEI